MFRFSLGQLMLAVTSAGFASVFIANVMKYRVIVSDNYLSAESLYFRAGAEGALSVACLLLSAIVLLRCYRHAI